MKRMNRLFSTGTADNPPLPSEHHQDGDVDVNKKHIDKGSRFSPGTLRHGRFTFPPAAIFVGTALLLTLPIIFGSGFGGKGSLRSLALVKNENKIDNSSVEVVEERRIIPTDIAEARGDDSKKEEASIPQVFGQNPPPPNLDYAVLPNFLGEPSHHVTSKLANRMEGFSDWCLKYLGEMKELPYREHRKQWEFCFMARALDHYGMLAHGRKGIGFAVGQEPLSTYFVKRGAEMLVSDLPVVGGIDVTVAGWSSTGQHSSDLKNTFKDGIIDYATYERKAKFIPIDMNKLPEEILNGEYDFVYSSSSLEHIGSVKLGQDFILNAMKALRKGGIAVHTTELAVNSLEKTDKFGHMSVWLKKDVEWLATQLETQNCRLLPVEYAIDKAAVDILPYSHSNHFILKAQNTLHTSISFVIEKRR